MKDLYTENTELKRTLYTIEKALCDFRISQLDIPEIPSSELPQNSRIPQIYKTKVEVGQKELGDILLQLSEKQKIIDELTTRISKLESSSKETATPNYEKQVEEEVENFIPLDEAETYKEKVLGSEINNLEKEIFSTNEPVVEAEPKEVEKEVKPRKERGGTVFKDFRTLELSSANDFEGNSIVYSKKGQ